MTISSTTSKVSYNGSGSVGPFTIPYKFSRNADIMAVKVSGTGTETTLALTTHYTLTGAGEPSGGTLTLVTSLAVGEKLVIKRSPAQTQEVDYVENAAFPAEAHEGALDLLTMICQDLDEKISRAVLVDLGSDTSPSELLEEIAADVGAAASSAETAETQAGLADAARVAAEAAAASVPEFGAFGVVLSETTTSSGARAALELGTAALVDTGTGDGDVPVLGSDGKLSTGVIPTSVSGEDTEARDLAAFHAFISQIAASRATGPVPKGIMWLFGTDELTKSNAYWNPGTKAYENKSPISVGNAMTGGTFYGSAVVCTNLDLNFSLPDGMMTAARIYSSQASSGQKLQVWRPVSGLTYSFVGESQVLTVSAGYNEIQLTTPIQTKAGDRIAVYSPSQQAFVQSIGTGSGVFINGYSTSTTTFISGGSTFSVGAVVMSGTTNMTLESPAGVALGFAPSGATLYLLHKAVDAVTLNADLILKASRGAGWASASDLAEVCQFDGTYKLLKASVDLSALASGSTGLWGLDTHNLKAQQVRAALVLFQ